MTLCDSPPGTATLSKRDDQDYTDLAARQTAAAQKVFNKVSLPYVGAVLLPHELLLIHCPPPLELCS